MKLIAHTPVGKFEQDLGENPTEEDLSKIKSVLEMVAEGKYSYFSMGDQYLAKNILVNSVFEILP